MTRLLSIAVLSLSGILSPICLASTGDYLPIVGWDRQVYPSHLIASASIKNEVADEDAVEADSDVAVWIGDDHAVIGIEIVAPRDNALVTMTIAADDWIAPTTTTVTLPVGGTTYQWMPKLRYRFKELVSNHQTMPSSVSFDVTVDGVTLASKTEVVVLHSINDCPFAYSDGEYEYEIGFVFAAYVNEQHPVVDRILREALDIGIVDSFTGYQSGDPGQTLLQVYAIWDALTQRDLRYSNITAVAGVSEVVASQHVRLIDQSIDNAQANCVDGSVLMASLLRKIDIEPWLVMVPGHCYLAFSLDEEGETIFGLETTMLGGTDEQFESVEELDDLIDQETYESFSYASFCAAFQIGTSDLSENMQKFEDEGEVDCQLISISEARASGILPIAYQAGGTFQSAE